MIETYFVVNTGMTISLDPDRSPDLRARLKAHPMEYNQVVEGKPVTRKTAANDHDDIGV